MQMKPKCDFFVGIENSVTLETGHEKSQDCENFSLSTKHQVLKISENWYFNPY